LRFRGRPSRWYSTPIRCKWISSWHSERLGGSIRRLVDGPCSREILAAAVIRPFLGVDMTAPLHHSNETTSNTIRDRLVKYEPRALRTYTPTQAVLARSAGVFHWTPEGRRLYDFTSGVLVANLGHNPQSWMRRFFQHMNWSEFNRLSAPQANGAADDYCPALPLTAYNAVTPVEMEATRRLI